VTSHRAVAAVAAVVTALTAPLAAALARRIGATAVPTGDRPGPEGARRGPVPTLGGLAVLAGVVAGLGAAPRFADLALADAATAAPLAVVAGGAVIAAVGALDDLIDLSAWLKLAGQVAAATLVATLGVQLQYLWIPGLGVVALGPDLGLVLTVMALVATVNVVNLVDGLDGLAAGLVAIGAVAFAAYVLGTGPGPIGTVPSGAVLVAAVTGGAALGFLPANWHPARVFLGDTGSMLLGLLLGAAAVAHVGRTAAPTTADFLASVPLLLPLLVLAVPFLDTALAVVRRLVADRPVTRADLGHLHHRLLEAGHPHRRAVLLLHGWSALVAFGAVGPALLATPTVVAVLLVAGLALTALTAATGRPAAPRGGAGPRR
jgi:UDP-GlcNAc:undecaprenyl-phosphate GlcNAc-1-phosphate transferase